MSARLVFVILFAGVVWFASCSKGIGNNRRRGPGAPVVESSSNLPTGFDPGVLLNAPAGEPAVAAIVVPAIGAGGQQREVALLAFTTAAASNDADGAGAALSRDTTSDTNSGSDVFVAALVAQDIEERAFSQSLAGKFRHPRCTTCHSMQAATTTAFASATAIGFPHQGPLPGPGFPNNDPGQCSACHVASTNFPVDGWQAPATSFDMRTDTVAQLVDRANRIPAGDLEHFFTDLRVLWALDSGILPQVGGNNGVADDDQDGVDEPEDRDGIPRPVPGGSEQFLHEIEEWIASGRVATTAAAVKDVTLVSRAAGSSNTGNGASTRPRLLWVPNPTFDPTSLATALVSNPIGTVFVAFQSEASDLAAGDANGASDVFRAAIELRAEQDPNGSTLAGGLNLAFVNSSTVLCSATNGTTTAANGASTRAEIAGDNAEFVAFESVATNLIGGFVDANGASAADVYVRRLGTNTTLLVSHAVGNTATGGSGASESPSIDRTGSIVAFESDASDLIASDTNGVRDVFHAPVTGVSFAKTRSSVTDSGAEATGGPSRAASVHFTAPDRVLVAFESDATNLAPALVAATNVYLFDSATGESSLLNQLLAPTATAIGNGSARAPRLAPNGLVVAFESEASNIDVLRAGDLNRSSDVYLVEVPQVEAGNVVPFRISLTATSAADGDGASTTPSISSFGSDSAFPVGVAAYPTLATNLGTSDATNLMVSFLSETSGVFANFTTSTTLGPPPLDVQFTDTSTGNPTSWQWDFDNDGTIDSTEQNPLRTFTTPGFYDVRLVAANPRGSGTKTVDDALRVLGPCVADFTTSGTTGQPPFQVTFTDTSTELPNAWAWDFGDGNNSTQQNPTHVYTSVGVYTVSLTATGPGGSGTETKTDLVNVAFEPPAVTIVPDVTGGTAPLTVNFTINNTGGPISSVVWNFDDPGSGAANTSTLLSPSHTFNTTSTFIVSLTATGPGGQGVDTEPILVSFAAPNVTVSANPTSGIFPLLVNFSFNNSGGPISNVSWNFGDPGSGSANTSTLSAPSHTFNTANTFTVTLTANGPGGQSIDTQPILVNAPPAPNVTIVANFTSGTLPLAVSFTVNNTGGPITSYSWNFDDPGSGSANTSTSSAPSHTFDSAGNFSVSLTVNGPGGLDTDGQLIIVSNPTWTQLWGRINAVGCTGCHTTPPLNGAPFSMINAATAHTNLVNAASVGSCAPTARVIPNNANSSVLVRKVEGTGCGSPMGGLNATDFLRLRAWINSGAPNN